MTCLRTHTAERVMQLQSNSDLGDRWGWSSPRPGRFTPGEDPLLIVMEVDWVSGTIWTGAENMTPT